MLIVRGVNVFPSQIEAVLLDIGETSPYYMIYIDRVGALDTMDIEVELRDGYPLTKSAVCRSCRSGSRAPLRARSVLRRTFALCRSVQSRAAREKQSM